MGAIELFLPFLASVVVFLIIRRIDGSSFRLGQIKKYSHRLNEDISQTAMNGIQSVKDATIDLELTNKQAKKLIVDIQKENSQTTSLLDTLKHNKEYLDSILIELREVVGLTDQIKEESMYVQEGMSILQTHRDEIKKVNQEIAATKSELKEMMLHFQEKLNTRTSDLLESLATKIVEIENLLEVKSDKIDESLQEISISYKEQLSEEVEKLAQETVNKVELANVRLDDFNAFVRDSEKNLDMKLTRYRDATDSISDRIERLDLRLEEKAETVGEAVEARLEVFEKKFQERFESIFDQLAQNKEAFLNGVKMEIDLIRTEIESMNLETMTRRDEILTEARRQGESVLMHIQTFHEKYLDAENKILKTAELKRAELMKEIHRFENDFKQSSEVFYHDAEELKDTILRDLNHFESDLSRATNTMENSIRERFNGLKDELEESMLSLHSRKKAEFFDELSAVDLKIKELGRETANKIKNVDDHFYDLKNALLESSKEIVLQVEREVHGLSNGLDQEKIRIDQKLEFFMEGWNLDLERIKSRTNKDVDSLMQRLKEIHIEGKEIADSIREEFSKGRGQLDFIIQKGEDNLNQQIEGIVFDVHSKVKKASEDVEVLIHRLQKTGGNLYEKQETLLADYGERVYRDLQNKLEKVKFESEELLDEIQRSGNNLLEKQEEKIDRMNSTIDERISRQLTILMDKGQLQLDQLETRIASYVQEVKQNMENTLRNTREDSERQIDTFNAQIQKAFRDMEKANKEFLENGKIEFERTRDEFEKMKKAIDSETNRISHLKNTLFQEFTSEESKIRASLLKLHSKVEEIEGYTELFRNTERVIKESELTVSSMNSMLDRLKIEGDSVQSYLKNIDFLKSSKKEIETEMRMLETQKIRIEQVENELARATNVCDLINQRTEELHDKINVISSIDHKLIEVSRIQEEMDMKLGEIRQANSKITEIAQAVQNTNRMGSDLYEKMQKLHREFEKLETKEHELQEQMNFTEERASELAARSLDVKSIESKFDKVEHLMMDLSTKHKQISTLQKRIETLKVDSEEMRNSMESLLEEADDRYKKLSEFLNHVQAHIDTPLSASPKQTGKVMQGNAKPAGTESEVLRRKRATVLNLYHNYSWTSETIAQKLNMEKSLVEAIIRES